MFDSRSGIGGASSAATAAASSSGDGDSKPRERSMKDLHNAIATRRSQRLHDPMAETCFLSDPVDGAALHYRDVIDADQYRDLLKVRPRAGGVVCRANDERGASRFRRPESAGSSGSLRRSCLTVCLPDRC